MAAKQSDVLKDLAAKPTVDLASTLDALGLQDAGADQDLTIGTSSDAVLNSHVDQLDPLSRGSQIAMAQATAKNPLVGGNEKNEVNNILKSFGDLKPHTSPSQTYVDHRSIIVPASVRDVPNSYEMVSGNRLLKAVLGDTLYEETKHMALKKNMRKVAVCLNQDMYILCQSNLVFQQQVLDGSFFSQDGNRMEEGKVENAIRELIGIDAFREIKRIADFKKCSFRNAYIGLARLVVDQFNSQEETNAEGFKVISE